MRIILAFKINNHTVTLKSSLPIYVGFSGIIYSKFNAEVLSVQMHRYIEMILATKLATPTIPNAIVTHMARQSLFFA